MTLQDTLDSVNLSAKLFAGNPVVREYYQKSIGNSLAPTVEGLYRELIARDPQNKPAYLGMISILLDTGRLNEAHDWAIKLIETNPGEKIGYFIVGVFDEYMAELQTPSRPYSIRTQIYCDPSLAQIPDPNLRKRVRDQTLPLIEEGFRVLQIALQLNPNDWQAMEYMSSLHELRASVLDDPADVVDSMSKGRDWGNKASVERDRQYPRKSQP